MKIFTSFGMAVALLGSLLFGGGAAQAIPVNPTYPLVKPFCWGAGAAVFACPTVNTIDFDPEEYPAEPPVTPTCEASFMGEIDHCVLGDVTSPYKIAVVGSSHARSYWAAFDAVGEKAGVAVHVFLKNACHYMVTVDPYCSGRNLVVRQRLLAGEFRLIIFGQAVDRNEDHVETVSATNYATFYRELRFIHQPFVVLKDNPALFAANVACLKKNKKKPTKCTIDRATAFRYRDFAVEAAVSLGQPVLDFSNLYCDTTTCPLVRGGMRIYRDTNHVTVGFAKTFAPFMWTELKRMGLLNFGR